MLVTTPNREYNLNFMEIPADQKPDATGRYMLPPLSSYPVRNPDHRFEWSRAEFREWECVGLSASKNRVLCTPVQ